MLLLDGQVHHDTHAIPMGNYVSAAGNYVSVSPSDLGNYVSADTWLRGHGSPCVHSAPSSPGPPPSTRSLRTAAASASKPSIPITGAFPLQ